MPVENRTADPRAYSRFAHQNHERLPLLRTESLHQRRRRLRKNSVQILFLFAFVVLVSALFSGGGL